MFHPLPPTYLVDRNITQNRPWALYKFEPNRFSRFWVIKPQTYRHTYIQIYRQTSYYFRVRIILEKNNSPFLKYLKEEEVDDVVETRNKTFLQQNEQVSAKTPETSTFFIRDLLNNEEEVSKEATMNEKSFNASAERIDGIDVNEYRKFNANDEEVFTSEATVEITPIKKKNDTNFEVEDVDIINHKELVNNEASNMESNNVIVTDQNNSNSVTVGLTRQG